MTSTCHIFDVQNTIKANQFDFSVIVSYGHLFHGVGVVEGFMTVFTNVRRNTDCKARVK